MYFASGDGDLALLEKPADAQQPTREQLLSASACASRLLLETADPMAIMPVILRELGEAAGVDRTALANLETDPAGARWLNVKSEWISEHVSGERSHSVRLAWQGESGWCTRLGTGQSVLLTEAELTQSCFFSGPQGVVKSSIIVPFLADGEFAGAVRFDDCRGGRRFEPAVVAALEIAASVIGAALQRHRLIELVRTEREQAAARQVAELAKANAMLRLNLEWLAGAADPKKFFEQVLYQSTLELKAVGGMLMMLGLDDEHWELIAHVHDGADEPLRVSSAVPLHSRLFGEPQGREPLRLLVEQLAQCDWPGLHEHYRRRQCASLYLLPLRFGDRNLGHLLLAFNEICTLDASQLQLLVALGHQVTLAILCKRLFASSKDAAVWAERNRIGQEIHDGLAQSFVGILLQLEAVEGRTGDSPLANTVKLIRDMAREGLAEARRSVLALRPKKGRAGLEDALRQLAARSTVAGGLTCLFDGGGETTRLAPEHEHELLRIAQEAVSNAVRHARASSVSINLGIADERVLLQIEDDGCGMTELRDPRANAGFGLDNMRERALSLGGEWTLSSHIGVGTLVTVRVPRPPLLIA